MMIPLTFGAAVMAVLLLALISREDGLQKVGLVLLFAWSSTNIAVETMGFAHAPMAVPTLDAAAAILVAFTGYRHRSRAALVVFALYGAVGIVHVAGFLTKTQTTYSYYMTLNLLFLAQLLAVGVTSAWVALHHRPVAGRERLGGHRARWPDLGEAS